MIPAIPQPATTRREVALSVWASHLNRPYLWGGDDPIAGFDCSGFTLEGLKSVGLFGERSDVTADQLLRQVFGDRRRYPLLQDPELRRGALVFWSVDGKPASRIRHVEVVWTRVEGTVLTIGASGGGSRTTNLIAAIEQNAYVRIRPISPGWVAAVDPFGGNP